MNTRIRNGQRDNYSSLPNALRIVAFATYINSPRKENNLNFVEILI